MHAKFNDTIAAISTPRGRGAIAIIRISGNHAHSIALSFLKGSFKTNSLKPKTSYFAKFYDHDQLLDEVLFTLYSAPHSYTGEDTVEIFCHGNDFIASQILEALLKKSRLAQPGEFTLRAFLNHKMDLTKAEAVGNLLMAQTKKAQQASLAQLEGKLEEKINNILNKILNLRIQCELAIDFIEDEVPIIEDSELHEKLNIIHNDLDLLERSAHDGMIIHEGLKVCLIGEPNVGKSSLFNKILDMDRAIVSDIPGTTRDYIEEAISLQGNLIRFFDTAGIRQSDDIIEKMGIERSNQIIEQADLIFLLLDAQIINENPTINHFNEYLISLKSKLIMNDKTLKIIPIINKADLLNTEAKQLFTDNKILLCSNIEADGLDPLRTYLLEFFAGFTQEIESGLISNARQLAAVSKAKESIIQATNTLKMGTGIEFIAFDLASASNHLEEIIGKITTDDILDKIFENFCIGK